MYFDETSLNLWHHRRKVWMAKSDPFKVRLAQVQGHNLTVLGAISSKRSTLCYDVNTGTDHKTVLTFFRHLCKEWKFSGNVVLVMDNHPSHDNKALQEYLDKKGISVRFLPPASSPLNPIEEVWAAVKRHFATTILELNGDVNMMSFEQVLRQCIETHVQNKCSKYSTSIFEVYQQVLDGKLV